MMAFFTGAAEHRKKRITEVHDSGEGVSAMDLQVGVGLKVSELLTSDANNLNIWRGFTKVLLPGVVAESVEHRPHLWKVGSSVPGRVKQMTYKSDTCCCLTRHSALIG